MIYVLDINFFIQAHLNYYPLDVFITFWEKIADLSKRNIIESIDKVENELYSYNGNLQRWCRDNLQADFFKDTTSVITEYTEVIGWANSMSSHYNPNAIREFLGTNQADAWLIAYCKADSNNRTLVTYEESNPLQKSKIKIPDACVPMGVKPIRTIPMLRELGVTL